MAGESQLQPESLPDPTVLTTDAIARAAKAERDYVNGQINQVNRTPTETADASLMRWGGTYEAAS